MQTKTKIIKPAHQSHDKVSDTAVVVCDFPNGIGCGICDACLEARRATGADTNNAATLMREVAKRGGPKVHTKRSLLGVFIDKINNILPARGYTWTIFDSKHRRSKKGLSAMPAPNEPDEPYRISFEITKIDSPAATHRRTK